MASGKRVPEAAEVTVPKGVPEHPEVPPDPDLGTRTLGQDPQPNGTCDRITKQQEFTSSHKGVVFRPQVSG